MKSSLTAAVLAAAVFLSAAGVRAADLIRDDAHMFGAKTLATLGDNDRELASSTGRRIAIVTVDSLAGKPVQQAAASAARAMGLRGAIIYVSRIDRQLSISYGPDTVSAFPPDVQRPIKQKLVSAFKAGDFDGGVLAAFDSIAERMRAMPATTRHVPAAASPPAVPADQGFSIPLWAWIIGGIVVLFIIVRALTARSAPAQQPPGGAPPGQYPPGQYPPGYNPGGGGGFMPGLLGGAVGGFIGGEIAGNMNRNQSGVPPAAAAPSDGGEVSGGDSGGSWSDSGGGGDFGGGDSGGDGGSW